MKGHATNLGNLTINVTINYDAKNATGGVIGSSLAAGLRRHLELQADERRRVALSQGPGGSARTDPTPEAGVRTNPG